MGVLSCLEPQYRLPAPDTPPELVSPSSSSYSSRPPEDHSSWNPVAPISPPMSNYDQQSNPDMSSGKSADETQTRRDVSQAAPRQQLPSLSSLFGPPPPVRPAHSPISEHPGPYAATSPLDRPHGSGNNLERSTSSSSYFPSTTPSSYSQPRSVYEPRLDDRSAYQPLNRAPFPGPLSPRPRDSDPNRPDSRSDYGSSSKWSIHQDASRNEYSFGGREPRLFKSPQDRYLPPLAGQKRDLEGAHLDYRDQRPLASSSQNLVQTSPSAASAETIPTKDGLGPKIWTGTHFLPRFVRAAEVPGEGMCYFYDDGSHCKTVIDGEAVNAHWGVTKAGKPRKRLAIACVTCREKKIKCDPDYPRCVQCEKFGRVCKFKNAPRGGHNTSPSSPPVDREESPQRSGSGHGHTPFERPRPSSHSSASVSPRTTMRAPSPIPALPPPKRMRIGYEQQYPPPMVAQQPRNPLPPPIPDKAARAGLPWQQPPPPELPRIHEDVLCRAWQTDPYVSDPQSVTSTTSSFFVHLDSTALRFLPEKAFAAWLLQSAPAHSSKSPEDLMLVYSALALGVALSGGPAGIASEYAQVARYATEHVEGPSLQLVQARIVLSLYYLSLARPSEADDMSSAAIAAASYLQFNLEMEEAQDAAMADFPFGLTRAGYAECRRRTFWACFILERLSGLFPTRATILNPEDVFLRLPAETRLLEDQTDAEMTLFRPHASLPKSLCEEMAIMSWLVRIVEIWGDVMTAFYRAAHRDQIPTLDRELSDIRDKATPRLAAWSSALPEHLVLSNANIEAVPREDRSSLLTMHMVYHATMVKVHRHVHAQSLQEISNRHLGQVATEHAWELLDIICSIERGLLGSNALPSPFTISVLTEVVDVLTAEGVVAEIPALLEKLGAAATVLDMLGSAWEDAKTQRLIVNRRMATLRAVHERTETGGSAVPGVRILAADQDDNDNKEEKQPVGTRWEMLEPLEARLPRKMDRVYHHDGRGGSTAPTVAGPSHT